jgi:hypothetical protein
MATIDRFYERAAHCREFVPSRMAIWFGLLGKFRYYLLGNDTERNLCLLHPKSSIGLANTLVVEVDCVGRVDSVRVTR